MNLCPLNDQDQSSLTLCGPERKEKKEKRKKETDTHIVDEAEES